VAILYPDCTYFKIHKSSNFAVARESFCKHKHYTLLKCGLVTAPDGHILDVHGPYFSDARNNDAAIIRDDFNRQINRDRGNLRDWVRENDIFIPDRGYRDAVEFLEGLGLNYEMPPLLPRNQRQFTWREANHSRLITKTRWIVESRNGHIKSIFKFFRDAIPMPHCQHLGDFVRIACAIINRFHTLIHMQGADEELAEKMLEVANQPNELQTRVENERLHLRNLNDPWFPMTGEHLPGFPRLPLEYLRDKTFGTYQVRLAPSYVQDRIQRNPAHEFEFETQLNEVGLLRSRLHSRFTNAIKYMLWISFIETLPNRQEEERIAQPQQEPIRGYYCLCKAGARTLGICAHVATVLWYLGYARYEANVRYPKHFSELYLTP